MYDLYNQVILNILVFTNKMQRVAHVKESDKNFQAFLSLSFFLKLIYLIKALELYISRKKNTYSFHLISCMGSSRNYSLRLSILNVGGPAPIFDLQLINLELYL